MYIFTYFLLFYFCLCGYFVTSVVLNNSEEDEQYKMYIPQRCNKKSYVLAWNNVFADDIFQFEGKKYYMPRAKFTFIEAFQFCKDIHMSLATVLTSKEVDALQNFILQTTPERMFWTSGTRLVDNRNWIWMSTMQVVEYTKWSAGQPDFPSEQCLELWFVGNELFFNNRGCNDKRIAICEKDERTTCLSSVKSQYVPPNINLLHFQGKSYHFVSTFRASFTEASHFCQMIDMKLVSITSEAENQELHKYARDILVGNDFWSSGYRVGKTTKFVWLSTGEPVTYGNWLPGQPGDINEMCLHLVHKKNEGLFWNDLNCDSKLFFICERHNNTFLQNVQSIFQSRPTVNQFAGNPACSAPPQYVSPNINLLRFEGKSYYFSTFQDTNIHGNQFCEMMGMKLVSINSEAESKILHKHIRDTGDNFWSSGSRHIDGKNLVWLSTGRTVNYTNWLPGQPDNVNEMCIHLVQNRNEGLRWNDYNCDVHLYFICERYDSGFSFDDDIEDSEETDDYPDNPSLPLTTSGGGKFRVSKIKETKEKAAQTCRQYGMELIKVPNKAKNDLVIDLINKHGTTGYYWTSGMRQSNRWIWSDRQPITYTNWYDDEPYSESEGLCLQLHPSGEWSARKCDKELRFICEKTNAASSVSCETQPAPVVNVYVNSDDEVYAVNGTDAQGRKIPCSCQGQTDGADLNYNFNAVIPKR